MASDLSKLIQDSITLTLNGLLAKDAKILNITQAHTKDLEELQVLKVQSVFDFSNFSSEFSFLVPGNSCSLIFNTMMGSPITDLSDEIDDDAEDAIGEFISNTSGSLTTAINGADLQDIGQTKFNIAHKEILQGQDVTNLENTYRFEIDLEDHELIIFINFDATILPYVAEICASEQTEHPEEVIEEVKEKEPEIKEEKPKEKEIVEEKIEEIKIDPKEKKLKIIIIAVGSLLGLTIISFFVMYFMGVFEPEPIIEEKEDINATKIIKDANKVDVIQYKTLEKVIFKVSDIDKKRLNIKLQELTKYKVLNQEELEAQKLAEKNRLFELEREKELIEFSKTNHEESLFEKKELDQPRIVEKKTKFKKETFSIVKDDVIVTNNIKNEENSSDEINTSLVIPKVEETIKETVETPAIIETENTDNLFYVVTNSLKYSLFKSLVQQTNTNQARISICNDASGKTTIYIGPFENTQLQDSMVELINSNNPQIITNKENITEDEFNIKCNLE